MSSFIQLMSLELNWVSLERDKAFEIPLNHTILVFMYVRHDKKKRTPYPSAVTDSKFWILSKTNGIKNLFSEKLLKLIVTLCCSFRSEGMKVVSPAFFCVFFFSFEGPFLSLWMIVLVSVGRFGGKSSEATERQLV